MKAIFCAEDWGFPPRQQVEEQLAFDIEPFVYKAVRQINVAVEAHTVEILREAFERGWAMASMEVANASLGMPVTPLDAHFEDWLEFKREEIRCSDLD